MKFHILFLILFLSSPSWAAPLSLYVQEKLNVYEEPDSDSKKISILSRGDIVLISPRTYGDYRKVQVTYKGQKQAGFILSKDIKFSQIREKSSSSKNNSLQLYSQNRSAGLGFLGSYYLQSGHEISSAGYNIEIGESTSLAMGFQFFMEWPWKENLNVRASFGLKNLSWTSEIKSDLLSNGQTPEVEDKVGFFAFGGMLKWYFNSPPTYWLAGNLEYLMDRGGRERKIDGSLDTDKGLEKVNFIQVQAVTGADIELSSKLYLIPEARLGMVINESPTVYNLELGLSLGYLY